MDRLFGADGVRGTANAEVTPELILSLGRALAGQLARSASSKVTVVVGRDPRPSSDLLEAAFMAGLCSAGADVLSVGIVPTAAVSYLTSKLRADAGVIVTASHNPLSDNGIKIFDRKGYKYTDAEEMHLEACVRQPTLSSARPTGISVGRIRQSAGYVESYIEHLVAGIPDLEGLPVAVDCANGAASTIAPMVYRLAGAVVRETASDLTGELINCGVGATNLDHLASAMADFPGAEIGIAHDGDADRLAVLDGPDRVVDGSDQLAIFAVDRQREGVLPGNLVVTSSSTNSGLTDSLGSLGIRVLTSEVSDRKVLRMMLDSGACIGGEQYGHVILLDRARTGDGILSALEVLKLTVTSGKRPGELANVWRRVPEAVRNVPVTYRTVLADNPGLRDRIAAETTRLGDQGRLIVRVSTIEPVVRIMCEARSQDRADAVADRVTDYLRESGAVNLPEGESAGSDT